MKNKLPYFILAFALLLTAVRCGRDDGNGGNGTPQPDPVVELSFKLKADNNPVIDPDSIIPFANTYDLRILDLRFYISQVELQNTDGEWVRAGDEVYLYNIKDPDESSYKLKIPAGSYTGIRYNVGLDEDNNHKNPVDFPIEHPLSAFQSMHWNWQLLYRFVLFDGRVNNIGAYNFDPSVGQPNTGISYHPGTDPLLESRTFTFDETRSVSRGSTIQLPMALHINGMFDGPGGTIDLFTQSQAHADPSTYTLTAVFMENFAAAISFEQ